MTNEEEKQAVEEMLSVANAEGDHTFATALYRAGYRKSTVICTEKEREFLDNLRKMDWNISTGGGQLNLSGMVVSRKITECDPVQRLARLLLEILGC